MHLMELMHLIEFALPHQPNGDTLTMGDFS